MKLALPLSITLLLLSSLTACSDLLDTDDDDGDSNFDVTLQLQDGDGTQRSSFYPSETLRMKLNVENVSSSNYTLYFDDSQTAEFEVIDSEGDTAWLWSEGQTFSTVESSIDLASGEEYGLRYDWNQLLSDSSMLPAGEYTVNAWFIAVDEVASTTFTMQ